MARIPVFKFENFEFEGSLTKLNRDKVYGWVETKYQDAQGNECYFVNILDDGKTLIGSGGLSLKSIDTSGNEIDKSTLIAKYNDGTPATLYPSVFDEVNNLSTDKGLEDYLSMDVKSVYQLGITQGTDQLIQLLAKHKVLYFTFNYRAGYQPDDAFLIAQGNFLFAIVGHINQFTYSTLEIPTLLEEEETEETTDELDFNMF